MKSAPIYSVIQVNQYIKGLLDCDGTLVGLSVRGEFSNYKAYPPGHHYFSLEGAEGAIRCVVFRRGAMDLRFRPGGGMEVVAFGRVTIFPRGGQYQLYCNELTPDDMGDLHVVSGQLKQKLYQEGLFDPAHEKPIPRCPRKTTLTTSPAGAAVRDTLRTLETRWSLTEVLVLPVRVQGAGAPGELRAAIAWASRHRVADLLITGQGDGSMEDSQIFNDEDVVRTIYASEIPVISAVGHEPDVTTADFAVDLWVATPSNAAELTVPDQNECYGWLKQVEGRLAGAIGHRPERAHRELEQAGCCQALRDFVNYINDRRMLSDYQRDRLTHGLTGVMSRERECFARLAAVLDALSPLKALGRGYAIPQRSDGAMLRSAKEAMPDETLLLHMADGKVFCEVIKVVGQGKDGVDGGKESNL